MSYDFCKQMMCLTFKIMPVVLVAAFFFCCAAQGQNLDEIGVTLLRAVTTNLDGSGIRVAQPEASLSLSEPIWEVNPASVGQPAALFTYISIDGTTNFFPNALSSESGHADGVGANFYGLTGQGVATNVAHVDNYDADFFTSNYVFNLAPTPAASVVNQSFTFGVLSISDQQGVDSAYDDYADTFGTLFVSAVANGGQVCAPGTDYNCIAVAAYGTGATSSVGPTIDNGRCKPDITAPAGVTSFSTPQVAGAAAILMQAALRGDGGSDTNSAADLRTIKALLLNGAVKPTDWTNSNSSPLDARYGAGVVNAFNAYEQLAGGKNNFSATSLIPIGAAHPPVATTNFIAVLNGWDFNTNSSTATSDAVNHYFFNAANGTATVTLVWNRQLGQTNYNNCINDLDLFLYNCANNNLVACSTSRVDNVEEIFLPQLTAGSYDLQVLKNGGTNTISDAETYALVWAFVTPTLRIANSGTNVALTWPVYPAGFRVEAATTLVSPVWNTNELSSPVITNSNNCLILSATNTTQFFRLRQPDF
jgi:hypothetical protein